eukprot:1152448-Pelagomonas_calceolata.AAC.3
MVDHRLEMNKAPMVAPSTTFTLSACACPFNLSFFSSLSNHSFPRVTFRELEGNHGRPGSFSSRVAGPAVASRAASYSAGRPGTGGDDEGPVKRRCVAMQGVKVVCSVHANDKCMSARARTHTLIHNTQTYTNARAHAHAHAYMRRGWKMRRRYMEAHDLALEERSRPATAAHSFTSQTCAGCFVSVKECFLCACGTLSTSIMSKDFLHSLIPTSLPSPADF